MPNEFSFDLKFTREEVEEILRNPDVKYIITTGMYAYKGDHEWEMQTHLVGTGHHGIEIMRVIGGCPRPC